MADERYPNSILVAIDLGDLCLYGERFLVFFFFYGFLASESLSTARFESVSIWRPFRLIITSLFPYV